MKGEGDARYRIQKLLVTGDNRLKQGVDPEKARESWQQALDVAREAGLEDAVRPLVEVRLADLPPRDQVLPFARESSALPHGTTRALRRGLTLEGADLEARDRHRGHKERPLAGERAIARQPPEQGFGRAPLRESAELDPPGAAPSSTRRSG